MTKSKSPFFTVHDSVYSANTEKQILKDVLTKKIIDYDLPTRVREEECLITTPPPINVGMKVNNNYQSTLIWLLKLENRLAKPSPSPYKSNKNERLLKNCSLLLTVHWQQEVGTIVPDLREWIISTREDSQEIWKWFGNSFKENREQFEKIKEAEIDLNLCKQEIECELHTTICPEIFGEFISDASILMDLKSPTNFQDVEKLLESEKYLVDEASSWL